jgi:hypothetical protein
MLTAAGFFNYGSRIIVFVMGLLPILACINYLLTTYEFIRKEANEGVAG